ncbi:MAG: hypothetical protein HND57_14430 [Planctomycetes bacterium]|nr:hypothetical protein [Planctomycetota bacterium]
MARKMLARPDTDDPGFTLHELKEMHQAGTLSDVEYRAARDALIANMTTNQDE